MSSRPVFLFAPRYWLTALKSEPSPDRNDITNIRVSENIHISIVTASSACRPRRCVLNIEDHIRQGHSIVLKDSSLANDLVPTQLFLMLQKKIPTPSPQRRTYPQSAHHASKNHTPNTNPAAPAPARYPYETQSQATSPARSSGASSSRGPGESAPASPR